MEKIKKIIELEFYRFDELEDKIQKRLIEEEVNILLEAFCCYNLRDELTEKCHQLLKDYGYSLLNPSNFEEEALENLKEMKFLKNGDIIKEVPIND